MTALVLGGLVLAACAALAITWGRLGALSTREKALEARADILEAKLAAVFRAMDEQTRAWNTWHEVTGRLQGCRRATARAPPMPWQPRCREHDPSALYQSLSLLPHGMLPAAPGVTHARGLRKSAKCRLLLRRLKDFQPPASIGGDSLT